MTNKIYDIFIIGAGPAGMTAAVYGSRANKKVAMIDKDAPGGQLLKTATIENWTGYKYITGADLAIEFYNHSIAFGAETLFGNVVEIKDNDKLKEIITEDGTIYKSKSVIISTGTTARKMHIPGEDELYGTLISTCAICDGALYNGKEVIVVGGGNSALEEAEYLSKFTKKITIVYRREAFSRVEATTIQKVNNNSKIETILSAVPQKVEKVEEGIALTYNKDGKNAIIKGACLFTFVGSKPDSSFVKNKNMLSETGYIIGDENTITSAEGIFVAGDVRTKKLRQIATAVGDGCVAAQEAVNYLDK